VAVILTYHAVDAGHGALFVDPGTFADHLDCIADAGARVLTVSELARSLRAGDLPRSAVAITFDDGLASVARVAAPLLAERGFTATVFCVPGHVGGKSDWASALPGSPSFELAGAVELAELAAQGLEIGCHGMTHAPLRSDDATFLRRELVDAKHALEETVRAPVTTFAYPYGATPTPSARRLVSSTYGAACTTELSTVQPGADLYALPRLDAHYVRSPRLLRAALSSSLGPYLRVRRIGASARRAIRHDYARTEARS
jgi:peptidoglycan/xylan/chitin deacetylase (PgdA/CDA1 family)